MGPGDSLIGIWGFVGAGRWVRCFNLMQHKSQTSRNIIEVGTSKELWTEQLLWVGEE
ncbi:uncharacterized protein FFNC_15707 [Fusarium fujikuroi]|nr:uncharacterized protein FFNC_15707 [Fusarium fujikuroi]